MQTHMHRSTPTLMQMLTSAHKHLRLHVNSICTHRNTCTHRLQVMSGIRLGATINLMFRKSLEGLILPYLHPTVTRQSPVLASWGQAGAGALVGLGEQMLSLQANVGHPPGPEPQLRLGPTAQAFYAHALYTPPRYCIPHFINMHHSTSTVTQASTVSKAERATWKEASSIPSWVCDLGQVTFSLCPHLQNGGEITGLCS